MAGIYRPIAAAPSRKVANRGSARFTRLTKTGVSVDALIESSFPSPELTTVWTNSRVTASISLPHLAATASLSDAAQTVAHITLPALTASAETGWNAAVSLPALTATASATLPSILRASVELPSLTATASVTTGSVLRASVELPSLTASAETGWNAYATLQALTATASATSGSVIGASVTLPALTATASLTQEAVYRASITLPSLTTPPRSHAWVTLPSLTAHAVLSEVVSVTYEAYAINMTTGAVTHYTNYPFDNIVRFGNEYYGVASSGVYLLGGALDMTTQIDSHAKTFSTMFGSPNMKRVPYVYSAGRSDTGFVIGVTADEGTTYEYESSWGESDLSTNQRTTIGKGIRGVYYSFDIKNIDGGSLELDSIGAHVSPTTRAI